MKKLPRHAQLLGTFIALLGLVWMLNMLLLMVKYGCGPAWPSLSCFY